MEELVSKASVSRIGTAIVVMLLLIFAALPSVHADDSTGIISGTVMNKTGTGGPVAGIDVTLRTAENQIEGAPRTTKTDAAGAYSFDSLPITSTVSYVVAVNYKGVDYGSDLLVFDTGVTTQTVDIAVYETTDQTDALAIDRAHIILDIDSANQTLPVMEILVITNSSDHTVLPSQPTKGSFHISIPKGATNFQMEPQLADSTIAVADGFIYSGPVQPGSGQLMYAYDLPYSGGQFDLTRSYDYAIQQLSFLMPEGSVKATSSLLAPQDPVQLTQGGPNYIHLLGDSLAVGTAVTVHLDGLPMQSFFDKITKPLRDMPMWAVIVIAVVVIGAIAYVVVWRRRGKGTSAGSATDGELDDGFDDDDGPNDDDLADEDETNE
jgi:hypothetical protein